MTAPPTLLYLVTEDWFFWSHRRALAAAARDRGYRVVVACRMDQHGQRIRDAGFTPEPLTIARGSSSPAAAALAVREITRIYRRVRPDLTHHVSMKMCLFGAGAARLAGVRRSVNAFTGLGYLFTSESTKARVLRAGVMTALRPLYRSPGVHVIVQNRDDQALLADRGIGVEARTWLIRGSGVDVALFQPGSEEPKGVPVVTYAGRLLYDKGLAELAEAAQLLKAQGAAVRFVLVGNLDTENPQGVPEAVVRRWRDEGLFEWWGYRTDMPAVWAETTIAVLPSWREGLPKSLLEAAAAGLPMVATDVPGCRELIRDGVDGLLVPVRDARALAAGIGRLLGQRGLRQRLGAAARERACTEFADTLVIRQTLDVYERMLDDGNRNGAQRRA